MPNKYRFRWILLLVLILALAYLIRVWNLNKESFWEDEGWTMLLAKGPGLSEVVQTMADDQHPPLYFAMLHEWMALTGNTEFAIRYMSLLVSLIGVALIYRLGADTFSPETGVIAALLLALADNDTFLAQDARHYAQMAILGTASTLFYLRYFKRPTRTNGIAWLLASAALMYTHYLGGFILIVQLIHMLVLARPLHKLGDLLVRWLAICVTWLPWAVVFVNQSLVRYTRPELYQSTLVNTPENRSIIRNDLIGSQFGITAALILLGLIFVTYSSGVPRFRLRPLRGTLYMALWLVLPVISLFMIDYKYPILTTRNFLLVTPVIWLLVAHGFMNLDRFPRALLLTSFVIVSLITVDAYFIKPPWRQVAADIVAYRTGDEPVLMKAGTGDFALRYHLGHDLGVDPATLPLVSLPEWERKYGGLLYPNLLAYLDGKHTFWLAYWDDPNAQLLGWFTQQGFVRTSERIVKHLETNLIHIYRYDRLPTDLPPLATFADRLALVRFSAQATGSGSTREIGVSLLWKPSQGLDRDYSFSVLLLDSGGRAVANTDSPPLEGRSQTSSWQVGQLYFDHKTLRLPAGLPSGTYTVGVKIYWYGDQKPLPVQIDGKFVGEYFAAQQIQIGP